MCARVGRFVGGSHICGLLCLWVFFLYLLFGDCVVWLCFSVFPYFLVVLFGGVVLFSLPCFLCFLVV